MIVEYDICCFGRTLKIDIFEWWWDSIKDYPIIKEMPECIKDILDEYDSVWTNSEDPEVYQVPLEEYLIGVLENHGYVISSWESVDWDEDNLEEVN